MDRRMRWTLHWPSTAAAVLSALAMTVGGWTSASAAEAAPGGQVSQSQAAGATSLQGDFARAAMEFGVPDQVLLAVSYEESLWESHGGHSSATGNYNVMGLTQLSPADVETPSSAQRQAVLGQRGDPGHNPPFHPSSAALALVNQVPAHDPALHTLDAAAQLIHEPAGALRTSMLQSARGGAALLAHYERAAVGSLPASPGQWYSAVARYSGAADVKGARLFADRVYAVIRHGTSRLTADGQRVTLTADPSVSPDTSSVNQLGLAPAAAPASTPAPECPSSLSCTFVPAAYQSNSGGSYGNYDVANRPADGTAIQDIVIHDIEGSASSAISEFQNSTAESSANYVISSTGEVTQMVPDKDIAWHAGNWYMNMHSIGIEHEGYALPSSTSWYTPSEYQSSAALVKYLAARFGIPLDRQHIIGHDDIPGPTQTYVSGMHWDPGPYWDWASFMSMVGAPASQPSPASPPVGSEITIDPPFSTAYEPTVTGCSGPGTSCPAAPANFVYLRTSPSSTAPLLSDPAINPNGSAGTTDGDDWGDKAVNGQTFVVAGESGSWTAIWYAGQEAWFDNPNGQYATPAIQTSQMVVTPAGSSAIPVYGRAYPEQSAYPATISSPPSISPLNYTIQPGQAYVPNAAVKGDYVDANYNTAEIVVTGSTLYYPIRFNHRLAYVKASDVKLIPAALLPANYQPVGPVRVLDTRNGVGGYSSPVGAGQSISLQVAGTSYVPAGASAVVVNVTAVNATKDSYVTVYPDGQPRPGASNLDFTAGETSPNLVVVPVGQDGKIDFYNYSGSVDLLADLAGYYTASGGSQFTSAGPVRVLDTRNGTGGYSSPVGAGQSISLQVTGSNGVPAGATAVVLNVTAVNPTSSGYVTVYPDGQTRPVTSNLDFTAGETFPNLVVVPIGTNGKIDFYNSSGTVNLIADLEGYMK
jgi:hypothetical protein